MSSKDFLQFEHDGILLRCVVLSRTREGSGFRVPRCNRQKCCSRSTTGILYTRAVTPKSIRVFSPMSTSDRSHGAQAADQLSGAAVAVEPIVSPASFKNRAYTALKNVIVSLDVYRQRTEVRLDERRLAQDFGISRTPVREAMAQLEREGFVRSVPRRGVYVVRKTKREVIELIQAWAALESMAARLITEHASEQDIAGLRHMFATFEGDKLHAKLDEYSEVNINFHQTIIKLSGNQALIRLAENLFTHMRMIRGSTIGEDDRVDRSIRDHMNIIEALEARDTRRAEDLVRQHALGLAEHVAKHADYLD